MKPSIRIWLAKGLKAVLLASLLIGLIPAVISLGQAFAATHGDNFDDNVKNSAKWGKDQVFGLGMMTERNRRLEYTRPIGPLTLEDDAIRPWVLTRLPYNGNWEMQIDTINTTTLIADFQVNSFGINILSPLSENTEIFAEMYASALGGLPARTGFQSDLKTGNTTVARVGAAGGLGVTQGAVRAVFDSATKVITVFCDTDISDGYQWVQFGSFGLAGTGGIDGNTDWSLTDTDQLSVYVYGYSVGTFIFSGQMYGDNFVVTGGVAPVGPSPTGSFSFGFPTNNPLLTSILNVTGNYTGFSPTQFNRAYSIDVAQDESGKLSAMGTVNGILDKNGSPDLSASIGAITTVNGKPTAKLQGTFGGKRDGVSTTLTATASGPVDVIDIGGGTQGIVGTTSYSGKVGGVPFKGKNVPLQIAAPPGAVGNLTKDWSLQLDIVSKLNKLGKPFIAASSQLILPNGDTIVFPEKKPRYSTKTGYTLLFTLGTNTTVNPPKRDRKTWISIKGMKLVRQDNVWQPTAGTLTYRFLGQKGTGNLLDFLVP